MIISRTPYRISFFGGGTDYPAWYRDHGGAVLSATINKYCYLTCRYLPPFFEHRIRVVWSRIELVRRVEDIAHPAVRETLRFLNFNRGLEIHHDGDLPGRSGVGSSSAFTVGLLHALHGLCGRIAGSRQLAEESLEIEQQRMNETVGSQDQISAAFGGLNRIEFMRNGDFAVRPMTLSALRVSELNAHLMLFYTGIKRTASDVALSYVTNIKSRTELLKKTREYVDQSVAVLNSSEDITAFGHLLHEAWQTKRAFSGMVSNPEVDGIYASARSAGALGGKLLGAGGGGFLLLFAPREAQPRICDALHGLIHVPFELEFSGSQIIFFDRQEDHARTDEARNGRPSVAFRELGSEPDEAAGKLDAP